MISVVYCTREHNQGHIDHIIKSSGLHNHVEVIEIINNGESLTKAYNRGLNQAKNDIVVFCHDDLTIETKQWGNKLLKLFERNPSFGIIGVAGSKNLPVSGMWWENRNKMYGRVQHTSEGKSWLSEYSEDQGQELEPVVLVDGLFFGVDKNRLKKGFNENVEGFHFYEITFCVENYLEEVGIGVTTAIRINHKSVGQTNDQWEANRALFAENFKEVLPLNVVGTRKGKKLKIMMASTTFNQNGLRDQILMSLAASLHKLGHDVTITGVIGGPLVQQANKHKVKLCMIQEPPGFRMGDGKWQIQTPNGLQNSVEKSLYQIKPIKFDVIHVFNDELIDYFRRLYPSTGLVNTSFSDGLFVNSESNDRVDGTITLKSKLEDINAAELYDNITKRYLEVL